MTKAAYELLRGCISGKGADDYVFDRADGNRVKDSRLSRRSTEGLNRPMPVSWIQPFTGGIEDTFLERDRWARQAVLIPTPQPAGDDPP